VHDHERIGTRAIDDAVVDELAFLVQDSGVDRLARIELADVARGGPVQQALRMRADIVDFLQARHVHQSRPGTDRLVVIGQIAGIGPRRAHAVPVFEVRAECAVTVGECGNAPGSCHAECSDKKMMG
jgi:hypothetical protein